MYDHNKGCESTQRTFQSRFKMKQEIEANYKQIKSDVLHIVESEMERIKNDPNLQHLVQEG